MVLNVHRNHKAYGRGTGGKGWVGEGGGGEIRYLSLHYHHQNDSGIKMGSDAAAILMCVNKGQTDDSNKLLIVRHKVTRKCPQTTTFLKRKQNRSRIEPRPFC